LSALFRQLQSFANGRSRAAAQQRCRRVLRAAFAVLVVMLCAGVIRATPLETYQEQVREAVAVLDALPQWKKVESRADYERRMAAAVEQLSAGLLTIGSIEWHGQTLQVDNKWLAEALSRYNRLPFTDGPLREAELAHITERLKAINERLTELSGAATNAASSDDEKKRLDAILQRPEFAGEKDEGGALARLWRALLNLWKRFQQWLSELFPRGGRLEPGTSSNVSGFTQIIVIAVALGLIAYLFWKFTPSLRRNLASRKREKREARVVLGERLEPDQTAADLLNDAEALARAGNLRAAIRKGYIALLCELGDRKIIGLAQHKTNRDYLRAVRQHESLHQQMQQLTQSFENHWYGFVPATENDWNAFRSGFQKAVTSDK
jgi:Domain of unknown function (DUF4129)